MGRNPELVVVVAYFLFFLTPIFISYFVVGYALLSKSTSGWRLRRTRFMEPKEPGRKDQCKVPVSTGCISAVHPARGQTAAAAGSLPHKSSESEREAQPGKILERCCVEGQESRWTCSNSP